MPLEASYLVARGRYPGMSRTVVRVTTEDGAIGLGETLSPHDAAEIAAGAADDVVGLEVGEARRRLGASGPLGPGVQGDAQMLVRDVLAGVEMALWDAEAREAVAARLKGCFGSWLRSRARAYVTLDH